MRRNTRTALRNEIVKVDYNGLIVTTLCVHYAVDIDHYFYSNSSRFMLPWRFVASRRAALPLVS